MATTYEPATAAEEMAQYLISEHHKHLKQARIVWLKTGTGQSRARVCNALLAHAFGKDASGVFPAFCVVVTDADWFARKGAARVALIDTLLCSMVQQSNADTGKTRWALSKPDVSMFLAVVKRHGLSTTEEIQVGKLIRDFPEQLALVLDKIEDGADPDLDDEDVISQELDRLDDEDDDPTRETTWDDATRPDVSPEALSRIRGSVEAAVK